MTTDLIRRIEAYQRGKSQEITRILIDCLAALQVPAEGDAMAALDEMLGYSGAFAMFAKQRAELIRAALAAPAPQAPVALTDEQWLKRWTRATGERLKPGLQRMSLLSMLRFAERAYGIPAPQTKEPKA